VLRGAVELGDGAGAAKTKEIWRRAVKKPSFCCMAKGKK
jgi:hypothetical protein